jgi:glycosyltransferase involved in cell wall biosynthesis
VRESRSVLHVLPHPGGGGETYVDALAAMEGFRFERAYLAPSAEPAGARASIVRAAVGIACSARAYDLIHVHGEIASALCLPSLATRPSVSTLHGLHLLRRLAGARAAAARANLRLVVRAASCTICVSRAEHDQLAGFLGRRSLARAVVIRNGVRPLEPVTPDERASARAELGIPPSRTVGAWVGSLDRHKDPLTPIRAVAGLGPSPVTLVVAGDGPLKSDVERAAHETENSAVLVLGFRPDVRRVLAASDFFVLSSRREGLSFALLEAMSLGLVPVVSDAPGNPEAVDETGVVVPFGDVGRFAAAFAALAVDEPRRLTLGELARERVLRDFRFDRMVERTREVYESKAGLPE